MRFIVVVVRSGEVVVVLTVICVDLFVAIFYEAFELQEFIITSSLFLIKPLFFPRVGSVVVVVVVVVRFYFENSWLKVPITSS